MRIYKNRAFAKFSRKEGISDAKLAEVARNIEQGKIDVDYGGGVIKQRIARSGEGKSGGYRAIIFYRQGEMSFFVHGFAKNDKANLSKAEERLYKEAAQIVLATSETDLARYIERGIYTEIIKR